MPTRKQKSERDERQRKRVRREINKNITEMGQKSHGDAMARLKGIPTDQWNKAAEQDAAGDDDAET